jgi:hypothetical protein
VRLNGTPEVAKVAPVKPKCVAAATLTVTTLIPSEAPLIGRKTSMFWEPAVFRIAVKVPTPLDSVTFAGKTAWPSLVAMGHGPLNPKAALLFEFRAVTETVKATPATELVGAVRMVCVGAMLTGIGLLVPAMLLVSASVAVTVCVPMVPKVTLIVPTPLVNMRFDGKVAALSVLVK